MVEEVLLTWWWSQSVKVHQMFKSKSKTLSTEESTFQSVS